MNTRRVACLVLALVFVGCTQSGDPNRPKTVRVTGTVTYNSSPVDGATVTFVPDGAGKRGAVAKTDSSGRFTLMTFEAGDGAIPGSYSVKIAKTVTEGGLTEEEMENWEGPGEPPQAKSVDQLPVKYKDETTSDLKAEVTDGGNDFPFELTD